MDMFGHFVSQVKKLVKVHAKSGELSDSAKALVLSQLERGTRSVAERHVCVAHIRIEMEDIIPPDTIDFDAFQKDMRRKATVNRRRHSPKAGDRGKFEQSDGSLGRAALDLSAALSAVAGDSITSLTTTTSSFSSSPSKTDRNKETLKAGSTQQQQQQRTSGSTQSGISFGSLKDHYAKSSDEEESDGGHSISSSSTGDQSDSGPPARRRQPLQQELQQQQDSGMPKSSSSKPGVGTGGRDAGSSPESLSSSKRQLGSSLGRDLLDIALTPRRKGAVPVSISAPRTPDSRSRGDTLTASALDTPPERHKRQKPVIEKLQLREHLEPVMGQLSDDDNSSDREIPLSAPVSAAALRISTPSGQGFRAVRARSNSAAAADNLGLPDDESHVSTSRARSVVHDSELQSPQSELSFAAVRRHVGRQQGSSTPTPSSSNDFFAHHALARKQPRHTFSDVSAISPRGKRTGVGSFDRGNGRRPSGAMTGPADNASRKKFLKGIPLSHRSPGPPGRHRGGPLSAKGANISSLSTGSGRHGAQLGGASSARTHRPKRGTFFVDSPPRSQNEVEGYGEPPAIRGPAAVTKRVGAIGKDKKRLTAANVDKEGAARLRKKIQNSPYQRSPATGKTKWKSPASTTIGPKSTRRAASNSAANLKQAVMSSAPPSSNVLDDREQRHRHHRNGTDGGASDHKNGRSAPASTSSRQGGSRLKKSENDAQPTGSKAKAGKKGARIRRKVSPNETTMKLGSAPLRKSSSNRSTESTQSMHSAVSAPSPRSTQPRRKTSGNLRRGIGSSGNSGGHKTTESRVRRANNTVESTSHQHRPAGAVESKTSRSRRSPRVLRKSSSASTTSSTMSGVGGTPRKLRQGSPVEDITSLQGLPLGFPDDGDDSESVQRSVTSGAGLVHRSPIDPVSLENTEGNDGKEISCATRLPAAAPLSTPADKAAVRQQAAAQVAASQAVVAQRRLSGKQRRPSEEGSVNMNSQLSMSPLQLPHITTLKAGVEAAAAAAAVAAGSSGSLDATVRQESKHAVPEHDGSSSQATTSDFRTASGQHSETKHSGSGRQSSRLREKPMSPLNLGTPDLSRASRAARGRHLAEPGAPSSSDEAEDAVTPRISADDKIRALTRTFVAHCSDQSPEGLSRHPNLCADAIAVGEQIFALWAYPIFGVRSPEDFLRDTERKEQAEQTDAAELARITATPQWADSPRHRPESALNTAHSFRLHTASSRKNLDSDDDEHDAFADLSYGTSSSDDDEEYGK